MDLGLVFFLVVMGAWVWGLVNYILRGKGPLAGKPRAKKRRKRIDAVEIAFAIEREEAKRAVREEAVSRSERVAFRRAKARQHERHIDPD